MALFAKFGDTQFRVGDLVRVHQKVIEAEKERTQIFEGLVISIAGRGAGKSFTVRRIGAGGVGVERIWPLASPWIRKIEVKSSGRVRRSKLYYLRGRIGKQALKLKPLVKANMKRKSIKKQSKEQAGAKVRVEKKVLVHPEDKKDG